MPRILVADDEPNIREIITFALERAGFATATARNGGEALQQFRRGPLDLIILDIGMPEMDGLEVCRQIRRSSEVPILFPSAPDPANARVDCMDSLMFSRRRIRAGERPVKPFPVSSRFAAAP